MSDTELNAMKLIRLSIESTIEDDRPLWLNVDAIESIEVLPATLDTLVRTRSGTVFIVKESAVELAYSLTDNGKALKDVVA